MPSSFFVMALPQYQPAFHRSFFEIPVRVQHISRSLVLAIEELELRFRVKNMEINIDDELFTLQKRFATNVVRPK